MSAITLSDEVLDLRLACVWLEQIHVGESSGEVSRWCRAIVDEAVAKAPPQERFDAVRRLLRAGGYRPAGRNKPAQEYLWRTVQSDGQLPRILDLVDVINAVSLSSGLPISLLATRATGPGLRVRYGRAGESFVFNRAGQTLDLEGLLVCASTDDQPLGTPVKDSMEGKLQTGDSAALAIVYAPCSQVSVDDLASIADHLCDGFQLAQPQAIITTTSASTSP
jgi:DNA/RNA-binding domain of Phe-tRNA-synthetase-like protein